MSKDLEKELKAYVDEIKPDLWSRIESQLPEQKQEFSNHMNVASFPGNTTIKASEMKENKKQISFYRRHAGLIAACVTVAILVPVYALNRGESSPQDVSLYSATAHNKEMTAVEQSDSSSVFDQATMSVKVSYQLDVSFVSSDDEAVILEVVAASDDMFTVGQELECEKTDFEFEKNTIYDCTLSLNDEGMYHINSVKLK